MVAFSTDDVPEEQRIELWEGHNAAALIGLRCRTLDGRPLAATELNVQLERIRLARVTGTSHTVERSAEMIRSNPADAVALYFTLVGEAFFYCDDGVRILRPGQLLVCDVDRPFLRGFSQGLQELAVVVPRDLFAEITGVAEIRKPVVVDFAAAGHLHANALAALVGRAVHPTDAGRPRRAECAGVARGGDRRQSEPAHPRTLPRPGSSSITGSVTRTCPPRGSRPASGSVIGSCRGSSPNRASAFRGTSWGVGSRWRTACCATRRRSTCPSRRSPAGAASVRRRISPGGSRTATGCGPLTCGARPAPTRRSMDRFRHSRRISAMIGATASPQRAE